MPIQDYYQAHAARYPDRLACDIELKEDSVKQNHLNMGPLSRSVINGADRQIVSAHGKAAPLPNIRIQSDPRGEVVNMNSLRPPEIMNLSRDRSNSKNKNHDMDQKDLHNAEIERAVHKELVQPQIVAHVTD